jgi:hypothetical protein
MKNISTGTGLCVLGLCLASYPIIDRVMPRAEAGATHVAAVVAAATAQVPPEPTVVWYGATMFYGDHTVFRAWSDGRVEATGGRWEVNQATQCMRWVVAGYGTSAPFCGSQWNIVSSPNSGYNASADINFDSKVDGADLGQVLAMWGNAPRQDIPPSTCPLNLINP